MKMRQNIRVAERQELDRVTRGLEFRCHKECAYPASGIAEIGVFVQSRHKNSGEGHSTQFCTCRLDRLRKQNRFAQAALTNVRPPGGSTDARSDISKRTGATAPHSLNQV